MTGSSLPSSADRVRSTLYFSSASYVDSASWLVTRRLPRTAVSPSRSPDSVSPASLSTFCAELSTPASAMSRCSDATYSSFIDCARSSAAASTRVSAADAPGCWTVLPVARGSAVMTVSAWPSSTRGSTPALPTRVPAVPSASRSSATSRCTGSVDVLPAVVAASWAASIASRLRVVNFSAPNWLI